MAFLVLLVQVQDARAQVPSSAQPGVVTRGLEQPDRSRSRIEGMIVVPADDAGQAGGSTKKVFVLTGVVLDGSSVYETAAFEEVYGPYIGQEVSFADLNAIARGMTRKYREDGYVFSRVILPQQKISEGVLHLQAVEGRVGNVEVTGDFKDDNGLIRRMADKIRAAGPANTKEVERYLLLIDDLPGITAKGFMKPSKTPGAGDLIIAVEQDGFEGSGSLDNRGSKFLGPFRFDLVAAFNSLFGIHDRTTVRALLTTETRELRYGEITHEEQVGSEGARVKGRFAMTRTKPGGNISGLRIVGDSALFDLEGLYPVFRGRQMNLNLIGGLNVNNTDTDLAGAPLASDRVRSVRGGARADFTDTLLGVNQFEVTATQGLGIFGATSDGAGRSRTNGKHKFLRFNATATRVQDLGIDRLSLFLSATGQYSRDALLAAEEFTVGGPSFGRAYDGGELAGDRGYAGVAELRYGGPVAGDGFVRSYQIYTFIDTGRVYNVAPVVGEPAHDVLNSAGLGARFNLDHDVSGYVEFDRPMNKIVGGEGSKDSRLFFSILKRF